MEISLASNSDYTFEEQEANKQKSIWNALLTAKSNYHLHSSNGLTKGKRWAKLCKIRKNN